MDNQTKLEYGRVYHIYQRGNNREPIFFEPENYRFFLAKYVQFIEPVAKTYAYCLLNNHFHLCIKTRTVAEQEGYHQTYDFLEKSYVSATTPFKPLSPSNQFRKLFISYAKAMNKCYGRTGSLFENRFGRS
ncbi:MAG: transposase [Chloroflexota bacterium]